MSELDIYKALREGGLTPAGACAMMGNMQAESGCISYRVQGDQKPPYDYSRNYTEQVDCGNINKHEFIYDGPNGGGYGLCQWTYHPRKKGLYEFTVERGVSISDEQMQCAFCIWELQNENADLYQFLCSTDNVSKSAERICSEFERPAINNFAFRINAAQGFYNQFADVKIDTDTECDDDTCNTDFPEADVCDIKVRVLKNGCLGRDVFLLQCGLTDMKYACGIPDGDFGELTQKAVKELQKANDMEQTGIADWFVWQTIMSER